MTALTARGAAVAWTDYLWFSSLDFAGVWRTLVFTRIFLVIIATVIAFLVIYVNLRLADRLSPRRAIFALGQSDELIARFQGWAEIYGGRILLAAAGVFGFLIGLTAGNAWERALLFLNRSDFGTTDPVFGKDIGFFVFNVPFYRDLFAWGFQLLIWTTLLVAVLHYLNGGIQIQQNVQRVSSAVKLHLSILFAGLAIFKAIGYWLDRYELLYSTRGAAFGATYTDIVAQRPALQLLVGISLVAAILMLVNIRFRGWTLPLVAGGLWLVTSVIVGGIIPAAVQRLSVEPNEILRESQYIQRNIDATRDAYDLSDISVTDFAASPALGVDDIEANRATIDNVRLWDPGVLKSTYSQLEQLRPYYQFDDVDVDRYRIDGALTQVGLAAREIEVDNVAESTWVNDHLVFTHGFGAVLSPSNAVSPEGQPEFLVNDIPPKVETESLQLTQPRIYFGEVPGASEFVFVGTKEDEVDALTETGEVSYNNYDGEGGVAVGSIFRRAALALRFNDFNTLISNRITGDSKALLFRNISDRVEKAAPFLSQDSDPYLVFQDGGLVWVVDLYTTTDRYPYASPAFPRDEYGGTSRLSNTAHSLPDGFNYVRNSVKAVIDAYNGTMSFYVVDPDDPVIATYAKVFPELFSDASLIPDSLRDNLRYPEDLFRVQSDMYTAYHVTSPQVFFNEGDLWQIARDPSSVNAVLDIETLRAGTGTGTRPMLPYYLLMTLPDEEAPSFLILQPFTPRSTPNMVGFLVAKSDPDVYGEMIQYQFPQGNPPDGPNQVGGRINQNTTISGEFTLLGQQGSEIVQGNMLVVPVEESVVYVQPVYLQGTAQNALPELKRVVVVFEDRIIMRPTLNEAIDVVFGTETSDPGTGPDDPIQVDGTVAELLQQAETAFEAADAALRAGDLARYAAQVEEAQALITRALALIAETDTNS
ncbi:MAG: UPF0182 family protein [Acidimicrobiia bacterium]|nr:UPF0182 family protein [Acidimicrobiia bacterium]NNF87601.1 UPF0182 family protein [Acidimicrobiia bacterium]NNL14985.1 UPF0182 family protein [Acidimicrobiia bacterium]NNL69400.1 UPF0182 family protein [Acidimicrobiia bacterium]